VTEFAAAQGAQTVTISAAIEAELAVLADPAERAEFLATLGLEENGLDQVIRTGYSLLDLITYFTAGPKESRAWTVTRGTKAPQAAANTRCGSPGRARSLRDRAWRETPPALRGRQALRVRPRSPPRSLPSAHPARRQTR